MTIRPFFPTARRRTPARRWEQVRLAALIALLLPLPVAAQTTPWRLADRLALPTWLDLDFTQRTRFEALDGQFRTTTDQSDQMLALRTTVRAEANSGEFGAVVEWMDSRQALADAGSPTPVLIASVNTAAWLQAYGRWRQDNRAAGGSVHEVRLGRQTIDLGSRRLVARNEFRNHPNFFSGLHYQYESPQGAVLRALWVSPIRLEPRDPPSLLDNRRQGDVATSDLQLRGLHGQWPLHGLNARAELYLLNLQERDSPSAPSRNRRLNTPGVRLVRSPGEQTWDFDLELALQGGSAHATAARTDTVALDHRAGFLHLEAGYRFAARWQPRLALVYDHATGDRDPTDGESNRFDTLSGARRFEHGPSGIMGAFLRNNIRSPGVTLTLQPVSETTLLLGYRPYWLASARDAWTTTGMQDVDGRSGTFLGHQVELRVMQNLWHNRVQLDWGGAWLGNGRFAPAALPDGSAKETQYGYVSVMLRL